MLTLDRAYIEQSGATNATELIQSLPAGAEFRREFRLRQRRRRRNRDGVAARAAVQVHAGADRRSAHAADGAQQFIRRRLRREHQQHSAGCRGPRGNPARRRLAVYGSDAIAGVVNFILKKNSTQGLAYAQYTWPQHPGGGGWEAGISKGLGDLDKDGWNIQGTFGFNHQDQLQATQRVFSAQGAYFPFS